VFCADDYFVKPIASDEFLLRVRRLVDRSKAVAPAVASKLTPRELEVLRLLAEGLDGDEIARRLFIAGKTVRTHIENILRKLQVHTRGQAIALAYRQDLLGASV
jgi:DNA-binding NarL/FixJ family response regulator